MRLYVIKFPDKGTYYTGHSETKERFINKVEVDKDINCVLAMGRENNARAMAMYLTACTGERTEVVVIERSTKDDGTIATFQPEEEEVPEDAE